MIKEIKSQNPAEPLLKYQKKDGTIIFSLSPAGALTIASLVGNVTAATQTAGNNTTRLATTAFVKAAIDAVIAGAPGALDTLDELAAAFADDANFAATVTAALALKAPLASPTFTGNPVAPTPSAGDNDTSISTTAFVQTALNNRIIRDYQAADIVYNNNSTLADTDISVSVEAGGIYEIRLFIFTTSAVASIKCAFAGTATVAYYTAFREVKDESGALLSGSRSTDHTQIVSVTGLNALTGQIEITGYVEFTTAGTFKLQAAQRTTNASNSTLQKGSGLVLTKLN